MGSSDWPHLAEPFVGLLPTTSLSGDQFEDFFELLLDSHRYTPAPARRVVSVKRWGRKGDKQNGIDFIGRWSDGTTADWQCKRLKNLTPAGVKKIVAECKIRSDEHSIVYSGEASVGVREAVRRERSWQILDRRDLTRMLRDLPPHRQREVLDATWGPVVRRALMTSAGQDAWDTLGSTLRRTRDPGSLLNNLGSFEGRAHELSSVVSALGPELSKPQVVVVSGRGGTGKSRLLLEAALRSEELNPERPIFWLAPGQGLNTVAMNELPRYPSVVVVEDAHREPESIQLLLAFAREVPGTQLLLGSRTEGANPVRSQLIRAGLPPEMMLHIQLGRLAIPDARALVSSITSDLQISYEAKQYLVTITRDTPYLSVVAANLIRRGLLTSLRVDDSMREQVLGHYEDVLVGEVSGLPPSTTRKLLAVLAAVGSFDLSVAERLDQLADLLNLNPEVVLESIEKLDLRGVVVRSGTTVRVVPDVLADQILESQAVIASVDSRFIANLWSRFGPTSDDSLITNLSALEWRLRERGLPSVASTVWQSLHDEVGEAGYRRLRDIVLLLDRLAFTEPGRSLELARALLMRLDQLEQADAAAPSASESDSLASILGVPPLTRLDVEYALAKPLGSISHADTSLLEQCLDIIWELRLRDTRPTNPHPGHPARVLADEIAELGKIPDAEVAKRIVRWVFSRLPSAALTPSVLSVLNSLVQKEGYRTVATDARTLSMRPYLVSPQWASSHRSELRIGLRQVWPTLRDDERAEAIVLLADAMSPPRGLFGHAVENAEVLAWEQDDLATMDLLIELAEESSDVVRQVARNSVLWEARRAVSLPLRYKAASFVSDVDATGSYLARVLVMDPYGVERLIPAPGAFDAFVASAALDEGESESIDELIRELPARRRELYDRATSELLEVGEPEEQLVALEAIAQRATIVSQAVPERLRDLVRHILSVHGQLASGWARSILSRLDSLLDAFADIVLEGWRKDQPDAFLDWLATYPEQSVQVRLLIGRAMSNFRWAEADARMVSTQEAGLADHVESVREAFGFSLAPEIALDFDQGLLRLRDLDIPAGTKASIVERSLSFRSSPGAPSLSSDSVSALLEIAADAQHFGWGLEHLIESLAADHGSAVARWASCLPVTSPVLRRDPVRRAVATDASSLADLAISAAENGQGSSQYGLISEVLRAGVPDSLLSELITRFDRVNPEAVEILAWVLSRGDDRDVEPWPMRALPLVRAMLDKVNGLPDQLQSRVAGHIRFALTPTVFSTGEEGADSLRESRANLESRISSIDHEPTRNLLQASLTDFDQLIASALEPDEEDDD